MSSAICYQRYSTGSIQDHKETAYSNRDAGMSRRRRVRTVFTADAINMMESQFNLNIYPDIQQREELAAHINVPEARVQVWFQNRRARSNKRKLLIDEPVSPSAPDEPHCDKKQRTEDAQYTETSSVRKSHKYADDVKEKKSKNLGYGYEAKTIHSCSPYHGSQAMYEYPSFTPYSPYFIYPFNSKIRYPEFTGYQHSALTQASALAPWFQFVHPISANRHSSDGIRDPKISHSPSGMNEEDNLVHRLFRFSRNNAIKIEDSENHCRNSSTG